MTPRSARGPAYVLEAMAHDPSEPQTRDDVRPQRRSGGAALCGRSAGRGAGRRRGGRRLRAAGVLAVAAGRLVGRGVGLLGVALGAVGLGVDLGRGVAGGLLVPAVVAVEARPLEDDADGAEHLAQPAMADGALGQGIVGERLDGLEVVAALGAGVLVRRHDVLPVLVPGAGTLVCRVLIVHRRPPHGNRPWSRPNLGCQSGVRRSRSACTSSTRATTWVRATTATSRGTDRE